VQKNDFFISDNIIWLHEKYWRRNISGIEKIRGESNKENVNWMVLIIGKTQMIYEN
jgi:hypothetical protein